MKAELGGLRCRYGRTSQAEASFEASTIALPLGQELSFAIAGLLNQDPPFEISGNEGTALAAVLLFAQGVHDSEEIAKRLSADPAQVRALADFIGKSSGMARFLERFGLGKESYLLFSNLLGKKEVSAGAVLFDERGRTLIEYMRLGHVSLPKGHVEREDGGLADTAKREIKEELGLQAEIDEAKRAKVRYSPHDGIYKDVHFFLGRADGSKEIKVQPEEVTKAEWVEPERAMALLTYGTDKRALSGILSFLRKDAKR